MRTSKAHPIPPRFSDFLASPIGEEKNGMELSLLSALARLNVDPWAEAVRLANMDRPSAVHSLTATIAKVPAGKWRPADIGPIASRLLERLPLSPQSESFSVERDPGRSSKENTWGRLVMPVLGTVMFFVFVLWWWR